MSSRAQQLQDRIDQLSLQIAYIPYNSPKLMIAIEQRDALELELQQLNSPNSTSNSNSNSNYNSNYNSNSNSNINSSSSNYMIPHNQSNPSFQQKASYLSNVQSSTPSYRTQNKQTPTYLQTYRAPSSEFMNIPNKPSTPPTPSSSGYSSIKQMYSTQQITSQPNSYQNNQNSIPTRPPLPKSTSLLNTNTVYNNQLSSNTNSNYLNQTNATPSIPERPPSVPLSLFNPISNTNVQSNQSPTSSRPKSVQLSSQNTSNQFPTSSRLSPVNVTTQNTSNQSPTSSRPTSVQISSQNISNQSPTSLRPISVQIPAQNSYDSIIPSRPAPVPTTNQQQAESLQTLNKNKPSYLTGFSDFLTPKRPAPPPPSDFNPDEILNKEKRLADKENELEELEEKLQNLEKQLLKREEELNKREIKLKQWEENLKIQKRNQIQILLEKSKTEINTIHNSFNTNNYNTNTIIKCQSIIRRFLHKKHLEKGITNSKTIKEIIYSANISKDCKIIKKHHHLWHALKEIITTEELYVKDLSTIVICYFQEILKTNQQIIKVADIQEIFSNINPIYEVNHSFLNELKKGFYQLSSADIKLEYAFEYFLNNISVYEPYYIYFDSSNSLRQKLKNSNSKYRNLLETLQTKSFSPNHDLDSLMIKPCQRLPRYKLLLQAVLSLLPKEHNLYETYTNIMNKIDLAIITINERKRDVENLQKVYRLANKLQCPSGFTLADPNRHYICHYPLCILPSKSLKHIWKTNRFGYLFSDVLIATKPKLLSSVHSVLCIIDFREQITVEELKDTQELYNCFIIKQGEVEFHFITETVEMKKNWLNIIRETLDKFSKSQKLINE